MERTMASMKIMMIAAAPVLVHIKTIETFSVNRTLRYFNLTD